MERTSEFVRVPHALPELPYALDALEPHISRETLEYHYGKHHRAYVTKLNELIKGTEFANMPLEQIIRKASGPVFNNAAQAWNHSFYWQCLTPKGGGDPDGALAKAIDGVFGSIEEFRDQFKKMAVEHFGSGWVWLIQKSDGKLGLMAGHDAENPLRSNQRALLTCDVWEHAYYIDRRNERPKYLDAFWNVVNWDFAARNLAG
jgi:Fe-Mn family superoxide dismutase